MRSIIAAAVLLFAAPAFAQDQEPRPADAATPPPAADAMPAPSSVSVVPGVTNPPMTGPKMLIATSLGDIMVQLDSQHAPASVANILRYVKMKHYDGTVFYRVVKGFVIQMGSWDAKGNGRGIRPVKVPLEADNGLHNLRGTVALGRAEEPDSAAAEFYINLSDNAPLDHKAEDTGNTTGYAVFGQVISGMEVVDAIGNVAVGDGGPMPGQWPLTPITVKKVTLLK